MTVFNNKLLFFTALIILFVGIFSAFTTVVYAKNPNWLYSAKVVIILKNDADINAAKDKISQIPKVKIIKTQYRDKEWSKMVNKMDLPKMENPFKNEFVITIGKKANAEKTLNQIKALDFVESIKNDTDTK